MKNIYIPMGEDNCTGYYINIAWAQFPFQQLMVREEGMPYAQHLYTFQYYHTQWADWNQRVSFMESYPQEYMIKRSIPARPINQDLSNREVTSQRQACSGMKIY